MCCKNCGLALAAETNFCTACGAKVIRNRLTLKNLFTHAAEEFLSIDNKFLITLIHLFIRPEAVIDGYINGLRKKYMNPISFFAIALTLAGFLMFIIKKLNFQEKIFTSFTTESFGNSDLNTDVFAKISELTFDYNSLLFVLLIPLLAIPAWIMFLDKKYNLTEHITAFIYILSQYSITSFLFSIYFVIFNPSQYLKTGFIVILLTVFYSLYCLKRIFNISLSGMFLRSVGFLVLVGIGYIVLSISLAIFMFASGVINIEDFGPRP